MASRGNGANPSGTARDRSAEILALRDVAAFARRVRAGVEQRFGVRLHPEPIFWGALSLD